MNKKKSNKVLCSQPTEVNTPPTFFYDLDTRFTNTITKKDLYSAKTVKDLIPQDHVTQERMKDIISFRDVKISMITNEGKLFEKGKGNTLNGNQLIFLHSRDYSSNFFIDAFSMHRNLLTGETKEYPFTYYITVIPEKQASFKAGKEEVINYLKENCQSTIAKTQRGKLKPGKISFTVTKNGTISNPNINSTSGYPTVDKKMVELINKLPGEWNIATSDKGEKIDQILVFSFGTIGC
jgi:hypothetical protein